MKFLDVVGTVRRWIGKLTDWLIQGRQAGLWDEKNQPVKPITKDELR